MLTLKFVVAAGLLTSTAALSLQQPKDGQEDVQSLDAEIQALQHKKLELLAAKAAAKKASVPAPVEDFSFKASLNTKHYDAPKVEKKVVHEAAPEDFSFKSALNFAASPVKEEEPAKGEEAPKAEATKEAPAKPTAQEVVVAAPVKEVTKEPETPAEVLTHVEHLSKMAAEAAAVDPKKTLSAAEVHQTVKPSALKLSAVTKQAPKEKEIPHAGVEKVLDLISNMVTEVQEEGEKESQWYDRFACYCKDTIAAKGHQVQQSMDLVNRLEATINGDGARQSALNEQADSAAKEIDQAKRDAEQAERDHLENTKIFRFNEAQMIKAVESLNQAITVLKSSNKKGGASFLQMQTSMKEVAENIKEATLLADFMGLAEPEHKNLGTLFLQQAPYNDDGVNMENYKFHSEGVITTLEKLRTKFVQEKRTIDARFASQETQFTELKQQKNYYVAIKQKEMDDASSGSADQAAEMARLRIQLTIETERLNDDQTYLNECTQTCSDKARTWHVRIQQRADELATLSAVKTVVSGMVSRQLKVVDKLTKQTVTLAQVRAISMDDDRMEAMEAEVEEAEGASFMQLSLQRDAASSSWHIPTEGEDSAPSGAQMVAKLLREQGTALKSTMLINLATKVTSDPFAKVTTLIKELIDRLLQEASNESTQKAWCDKSMGDAKQKRDYASQDMERLNGRMAGLEAQVVALKDQLQDTGLPGEIKELEKQKREMQNMRHDEKQQNEMTITQAEEGIKAIEIGKKVVSRFYGALANRGKEAILPPSAAASLLQVDQEPTQKQKDIRNRLGLDKKAELKVEGDGGFASGSHYKGKGGGATGVVKLLEMLNEEFRVSIKETKASEKKAADKFRADMTELETSLQVKETAVSGFQSQLNEAHQGLFDDDGDLVRKSQTLGNALEELIELEKVCVNTGMSWEERIEAQKKEIAALKKAECIFNTMGPGGEGDVADCDS